MAPDYIWELAMANVKGISVGSKENPNAISDSGRVRIGSVSPAFPPVRTPANTSDTGKVRVGSVSPAFPPARGPANTSDAGKVHVGSVSPAFPPVRSR